MILAKRLMMCLLKAGWGEWILNPAVTVNTNGISHYTAYKTNQREYYDSYANLDLTEAIVRSLHDENMQQWQAVIDACNELTGGITWLWDEVNGRIFYKEYDLSNSKYLYYIDGSGWYEPSVELVCEHWWAGIEGGWGNKEPVIVEGNLCKGKFSNESNYQTRVVKSQLNPNYNPDDFIEKYVSFLTIAQKIISNASSSDQAISLLAEAYLENVAQSIFNPDESKQFVKLSDLIDQFEENKVLRI